MSLKFFINSILVINTAIGQVIAHESGPTMKMYFHSGINDYIMFKSWVPKSVSSYVSGWLLFFLLAVLLEAILVYCHNVQDQWLQESEINSIDDVFSLASPEANPKIVGFFTLSIVITWYRALILTFFKVIESYLAYFLMLVTMIYNTGLFFSVVTGHAVGVFIFFRFRSSSVKIPKVPSRLTDNSQASSSKFVQEEPVLLGDSEPSATPSSCH